MCGCESSEYWAMCTSCFLLCRPMITWYTLERGVGKASQKSKVVVDRRRVWSKALWLMSRMACSPRALGCTALLCCKTTPIHSPVFSLGLCPTTEDCCSLFMSWKLVSSLPHLHMHAERGHLIREELGKALQIPPGGKVLRKEKAKRRNEWENKWITDRMSVSASRKISLWLPQQREVPVGSAPDITS